MGQAYSQRPPLGRRGAVVLIVVALIFAGLAFFAAYSYVTGEARRVAAPIRDVVTAARDIPAGTLVSAEHVAVARMPIPDDVARHFTMADENPVASPPSPLGVASRALAKGRPILTGDLLPPQSADSVAPLVPLTTRVAGREQPAVGALNIPLGRLAAPPPAVTTHDRIDVWAWSVEGSRGSAESVLSEIEIIAFTGAGDQREGIVVAVTTEQLERWLRFDATGAAMIVTVRPAPRR